MQNPKTLTVFTANCRGNPTNCLYPHRIEITDEATASEAFSRDFVCAEYRNNDRSVENFLITNTLPMEFNETLWHTLVDHVTVYNDERIVFTFTDGTEIVTML